CTLSTQIAFNDDACGLQSEVTFLSDGTSTYVIMVEGFSSNTGAYTIDVSCELPPPPPADCDDHEVLSNNLENGYFFTNQLAADVPVADTGFTVYGVDLNVFIEGAPEGLTFSATFYNSVSGMPGSTVEHTTNATIYASEFVGTAFGYDIYNYIIAFETPAVLDANTTYWMSIDSDGVAWEATTASTLGSVGYINTGAGWAPTDGGEEFVYKLVCEELGISDMNSFDFTYYPNPVKDVLNIDSKQSVENVSVFNLAGQKVMADAKVSNGQINVNALTPGTYVFRVTLEGGQVETFKIIKK